MVAYPGPLTAAPPRRRVTRGRGEILVAAMRAFTPQQLEVVVRRVLVEDAGRSTESGGDAAWVGGTGVIPKGPPGQKKATDEDEEEEEEEDETEPLDRAAPPAPTGEPRATVVVIDHELSPRQLRNIDRATSAAEVLDRTGVIIEIFHRHASELQSHSELVCRLLLEKKTTH